MRQLIFFILFAIFGFNSCSKDNIDPNNFKIKADLNSGNCGSNKITFTTDSIIRDLSKVRCMPNIIKTLNDTLSKNDYNKLISFIDQLNLMELNASSEALSHDMAVLNLLIQYKGKINQFSLSVPTIKKEEEKYKDFVDFITSKFFVQIELE